ncbi:MAG: glycosyltransferase [Acidobacteriota bacterium]|nr:glycosyltransferase [Acidobacteriota bacterium]
MRPQVLMLSPEPPYPLQGGGAYRIASLLHYFARSADIDLVLISENGKAALLPPGLVRDQFVIPLPKHGKGLAERYLRNARRAIAGVPPLIDRLAGLNAPIRDAIAGRRYSLGIAEHFWCAPYVALLSTVCERTVLDLHNVESVLHQRCASVSSGLIAAGHRRFARMSKRLEAKWLPRYSLVLTTSAQDAALAADIAPSAHTAVYPNALPWVDAPRPPRPSGGVVFSGNFEYHPNIDAVQFLANSIWPAIHSRHPGLKLRLVGRGDAFVRPLVPMNRNIELTGAVESAFDEIARAEVVVAPLRAGSGTRIKILEAWSAARPVIATPLAAEGLAIKNGENILLADSALSFADALGRLLSDTGFSQRIAAAGRQTFESHYTWRTAWQALDINPQLTLSAELNRYTG